MEKEQVISEICQLINQENSMFADKNTKLFDDLDFDSISIIDLVVKLEEFYKIEFEVDDLLFDNFKTVSKIADKIIYYLTR